MNRWIKSIHSWIYPPTCLLCGADGAAELDLCQGCLAALPKLTSACTSCALPLPDSANPQICGQCLQHPPSFNRTQALFRYEQPVAGLIQQLKFNGHLAIARSLGELLAQQLTPDPVLPDAILPVPLHSQRLRQRGFNQALELARPLARRFGLPLLTRCCQRTRATLAQTALSAQQRRKNLRGAFQVMQPLPAKHIAIVDDVMTTGQTVNELAKTLRKAGAERIDVWVCARADRG